MRWLLGALRVLVLWTVWDRETVIEKNIHAFELRSLYNMDTTGLPLLPSGATGFTRKHGLGLGLMGNTAVKKAPNRKPKGTFKGTKSIF